VNVAYLLVKEKKKTKYNFKISVLDDCPTTNYSFSSIVLLGQGFYPQRWRISRTSAGGKNENRLREKKRLRGH
jgi:hypothetical protein